MSTIYLSCGCSFSMSMFADGRIMGVSFCTHHCTLFERQIRDLWKLASDHPINPEILKRWAETGT